MIDCDPGQDDAIALLLAFGTPTIASHMGDDIDCERDARVGRPKYDPTVIAHVARSEMFATLRTWLEVGADSGPSHGSTHFDLDGPTDGAPNCTLVCGVDAAAFRRHVVVR